jgi:hypothetical protein
MQLFVGQQVVHEELGEGRVEEVWPAINGPRTYAQVHFNSGTYATYSDAELKEVKHGNS